MALDWFVQPPSTTWGRIGLGAEHQPYYGSAPHRPIFTWVQRHYPDIILKRPRIGAFQRQFYAGSAFPEGIRDPAGFTAIFPAIVWPKKGLHASLQRAFVIDRFTFVTTPQIVWYPHYPDQTRRLPPRQGPSSVWTPIVNLPPVPALTDATYPDWIPRPRRGFVVEGELVPPLFPTTVVTFGWKGAHPDWIERKNRQAHLLEASVRGLHATNPTLLSQWKATYADQILPALRVILEAQRLDTEPIPNPPSPELAWKGWHPDQIARAETLRAHLQQAWASDRIRPESPDLAWRVTAPDLIHRVTLSVAAMPAQAFLEVVYQPDIRMDWQSDASLPQRRLTARESGTVRPPEVPASPVVWIVQRQDPPPAVTRRAFLIPGGADVPPALAVIGDTFGWHQAAPSLLLRATSRLEALTGGAVAPVLPEADSWCVMFTDDAILAPILHPELVNLPSLSTEMVRTPTLHNEEVC